MRKEDPTTAVEQTATVLLGILANHGMLPPDIKPAHNAANLLVQHLEALEQDAQAKGGIQQLLAGHFTKVYKAELSTNLTT